MNEFEGSGLSLDDVLEEEHGMISGTLMQKALRALEVRDATRVLVMEVAPFTPVDKLREYVDTMCEVNQMAVLLASRQTYGNVFMVAGVDVVWAVTEFSVTDWVEYAIKIVGGHVLAWSMAAEKIVLPDRAFGSGTQSVNLDVALSSARKYAFDILEKING